VVLEEDHRETLSQCGYCLLVSGLSHHLGFSQKQILFVTILARLHSANPHIELLAEERESFNLGLG
jgi:hypothetical protein